MYNKINKLIKLLFVMDEDKGKSREVIEREEEKEEESFFIYIYLR